MKIKIELQGREIELTIDEARQIHHDLGKIFSQPQPIPYYPPVQTPDHPWVVPGTGYPPNITYDWWTGTDPNYNGCWTINP